MFCSAIIWKRYSFPMRRAGSPVHVSSLPSTRYLTPASFSTDAIARATCCPRPSSADVQPTHSSTSCSGSSLIATASAPSIQSVRVACVPRHGCPRCSIDVSAFIAPSGTSASSIVRNRRMSTMESMCSTNAGHASMHARHVVHDQSTSVVIALCTRSASGGGGSASGPSVSSTGARVSM